MKIYATSFSAFSFSQKEQGKLIGSLLDLLIDSLRKEKKKKKTEEREERISAAEETEGRLSRD